MLTSRREACPRGLSQLQRLGLESTHASISSNPTALQDFFQLLRPGLDILRPGKPAKGAKGPGLQHFTAEMFRELHGIEPHQVPLPPPLPFPFAIWPSSVNAANDGVLRKVLCWRQLPYRVNSLRSCVGSGTSGL